MRFRIGSIASNWQLKLAAVALAILLWVVVSAEQITTQWIRGVPVEIALLDPDFVVTARSLPAEVDVRFAGPGRELWELALDRPALVLPVTRVEDDDLVFVLDPQMVRIPNGLNAVRPLDVRPSSVRLPLERLVSREVPVRLRLAPGVRERFVLLDTPSLRPAFVRITGAASRVAGIREVRTEPLLPAGSDTAYSRVLRIDGDSLPGVRFSPAAVRATGQIDRMVERILPRITLLPIDSLEAQPARVEVRILGPARRVRGVDAAGVSVGVPPDSIPAIVPAGGAEVPLIVQGLPAGLGVRTVPARVRIFSPGGVPVAVPESPPSPPPDTLAPEGEEP
jgi:hypothetical protein